MAYRLARLKQQGQKGVLNSVSDEARAYTCTLMAVAMWEWCELQLRANGRARVRSEAPRPVTRRTLMAASMRARRRVQLRVPSGWPRVQPAAPRRARGDERAW